MATEWVIAGLGNPGPSYSKNRHNAGFLALDAMASSWGIGFGKKEKFSGLVSEGSIPVIQKDGSAVHANVLLIKPMQYMNRSGQSVCPAAKKNGIDANRLIVLHDETEIPFGDVRVKTGGGHRGHNGLRDIIARCGSADFHRIRMGVGRPEEGSLADYVLANFSKEEQSGFDAYFEQAKDLVERLIRDSV